MNDAPRGFWPRLEARLQGVVADRERLTRWYTVASWVSTAVVALGFLLIVLYYVGVWRP